jgi:putative transposase
MSDRQAFAAIVYVLRTGIQWNALPRELGASSTVHDRFQEWGKEGFEEALWQAGLEVYDEVQGIQWEWQAVDGALRHLPLSAKERPVPIPPIAASRESSAFF